MLIVASDLTADEEAAFRLWKGNDPVDGLFFADAIDTWLPLGMPASPHWQRNINDLLRLFERSSLPHELTVYRATSDKYIAPYITEDVLTNKGFMATGLHDVQRHFSGHPKEHPAAYLVIQCPAGLPAVDGEMFSEFGRHEGEILLPPGTRFRVTKVSEFTDYASMSEWMGGYYAKGYGKLKVYELVALL